MKVQDFRDSINNELDTIRTTLTAKNADYAGGEDPFKNFRQIEVLTGGRVSLLTGILCRISDKTSRIGTLLDSGKDPAVKDESLEDAYRDLAAYAVLSLVAMQGESQVQEVGRFCDDVGVATAIAPGPSNGYREIGPAEAAQIKSAIPQYLPGDYTREKYYKGISIGGG